MIVVDSSALVSILLRESGWEALLETIASAESALVSAASIIEVSMVIRARLGDEGETALDELIRSLDLKQEPVGGTQVEIARDAFRRFGKGRHPAGLNFGDLFPNALARSRDCPLLFVGDHFARTDIAVAARSGPEATDP
ncbi:MAG: type II toxin-antitoxin system VapC family toxin [Geminicoccaceae bacterium]